MVSKHFYRKALNTDFSAGGLVRYLGPINLTLMGIGATIGAGIFVLTGTVAANYAGPAVMLSFGLAGLACLCAGLCYAEFSSIAPNAGSAYSYTFATFGALPAWLIGWTLVLEYLLSGATVAVGWSAYFSGFLQQLGINLPLEISEAPIAFSLQRGYSLTGAWINLPALLLTGIIALVLIRGISLSSRVNDVLVILKVSIVLSVIFVGVWFIHPSHWRPFLPRNSEEFGHFGWSGVARGAGVVFFAYVGFDMVSTSALEAKNPQRDVPVALISTLLICTALYVAVAAVVTGLISYSKLDVANPVLLALQSSGPVLRWLSPVVAIGAIVGLASALMVTLYGQTRIFYAMSQDGFLPKLFSRLHPRWRTPAWSTAIVAGLAGLIAAVFPIQLLGELASIGTLLAFAIVCLGVMLLDCIPGLPPRGFRTPGRPYIPMIGVMSCLALMMTLPVATWARLLIWSSIGGAIYLLYGRHAASRSVSENPEV